MGFTDARKTSCWVVCSPWKASKLRNTEMNAVTVKFCNSRNINTLNIWVVLNILTGIWQILLRSSSSWFPGSVNPSLSRKAPRLSPPAWPCRAADVLRLEPWTSFCSLHPELQDAEPCLTLYKQNTGIETARLRRLLITINSNILWFPLYPRWTLSG